MNALKRNISCPEKKLAPDNSLQKIFLHSIIELLSGTINDGYTQTPTAAFENQDDIGDAAAKSPFS
jgi:hypothetical protein